MRQYGWQGVPPLGRVSAGSQLFLGLVIHTLLAEGLPSLLDLVVSFRDWYRVPCTSTKPLSSDNSVHSVLLPPFSFEARALGGCDW